jgi:hypothetical protein
MNPNFENPAKFAFVVAEKEEYQKVGSTEPMRQWTGFLDNVQRSSQMPEGTQKIHENVWLIPLATGLPFLTKLIDWGEASGVSIRILFLAEAPNWIKYPPTSMPKT